MTNGSGEATRFRVAADVGDLELLFAWYVNHRFAPHAHDGYSIGVVLRGAMGFDHERRRGVVPRGAISAVNPGEVHTGHPADRTGWCYRNFFVGQSFVKDVLGSSCPVPRFRGIVVEDPELARRLCRLHVALETAPETLHREALAAETLRALFVRHAGAKPAAAPACPESARRVREFLDDSWNRNPKLRDCAAVVGLSRFHVLRVFRDAFGLTPHQYVTNLRVLRAQQHLRDGRALAETAALCGFVDQSHLARRFKEAVGITPGKYARAFR